VIIEGGIIIAAVGAGALADKYSTDHFKKLTGTWLAQARSFDWHAFVAQRSWGVYTKVFGNHSASIKFIVRSALIYFMLCAVSALFLFAFFPSTYASIESVWRFGSIGEQFWWVVCMLGGAGLYTLANAQTLYFLEILKTAPNFFKFFLVAYADFLLTASVSLFGVPLLLLAYTSGVAYSSERMLTLTLDFSKLEMTRADETSQKLQSAAQGKSPENYVVADTRPPETFTVRFRFADQATGMASKHADYEALQAAVRQGKVKAQMFPGNEGASIYDDEGQLAAVVRPNEPYEDEVTIYNSTERRTRDVFCKSFARGALQDVREFTASTLSLSTARELMRSCQKAQSFTVTTAARINGRRIDRGSTYKRYLLVTLSELTFSLSSGFQSYLTFSPYAIIGENHSNSLWGSSSRGSREQQFERGFDEMILKALLTKADASNNFVHRGLPAGTINFAIMSTAVFNVAVMSTFFFFFPLVKLIAKQDFIGRYIDLERSPFTILSAILSLWVSAIVTLGKLF
jgi:hypothetical protein